MKIFDTSSVICIFSEISFPKILDICIKRGETIAVPSLVYEELKKNKNTWEKFRAFSRFDVTDDFDKDEYERLQNRYPGLHPGEISVICCGLQRTRDGRRHYCIIDETPARKLAKSFGASNGLKLTGTVGLAMWQKEISELSQEECKVMHKSFIDSEFRIKEDILRGLLE
jgi:predicted nucleic acid-binding protein